MRPAERRARSSRFVVVVFAGIAAACGGSGSNAVEQCTAAGKLSCTSDGLSVLECRAAVESAGLAWTIARACSSGACVDGACLEDQNVDGAYAEDEDAATTDVDSYSDESLPATPPIDEQVTDFGGRPLTTLKYTGRLRLPVGSTVGIGDILVKTALDETPLAADGTFQLRMNSQSTAMITASLNGQPFMLSVFPKHPDLRQNNPEITTRSTALALVAMMPGVLTGDERLDALLLEGLKRRPELESLSAVLDAKLAADTQALQHLDQDVVNGVDAVLGALDQNFRGALALRSASLDPCYSADWPVIDGMGTEFYDVDAREGDALFIQAAFNEAKDHVTFRVTNAAPRWVSLKFNGGWDSEQWVGLVPPRKIEVPGVSKLLKDLIYTTGSTAFNEVFGEHETFFWSELRESLDNAYIAHFDCKYVELKNVPFAYNVLMSQDAYLVSYSLGASTLHESSFLPGGLTIATQAIFPLLSLYLDVGNASGVKVLEGLSAYEIAELDIALEVMKGPMISLGTALANSEFDLGVVLDTVSDLVEKACTSSSFWESVRMVFGINAWIPISEGLEQVQKAWKTLVDPFKWYDTGMSVVSTAYAVAYMLDVIRDFDSTDQYAVDPCRPDQFEPNDIESLAADVVAQSVDDEASPVVGGICPGDVDWFYLEGAGQPGKTCEVTVTAFYFYSTNGLHGDLKVTLIAFDEELAVSEVTDNGYGHAAEVSHIFEKSTYVAIRVEGSASQVRNDYGIWVTQECVAR